MNLPIDAKDGRIGKLKDCLFDDRHWTLRYFVADTGKWLPGRKVLLSPLHFDKPEAGIVSIMNDRLPVSLTKEQIEKSPPLENDMPISRQYEIEYARYYNHNVYWDGPYYWGVTHAPEYGVPLAARSERQADDGDKAHQKRIEQIEESSLRSIKEVTNYAINTEDEEFGYIHDFLIDENYWRLHYLIVDSRKWLPGKKFLIDIDWVKRFSWANKTATIGLTRDKLEAAPEFDPDQPLNDRYIENLYEHYGMRPREDPLRQASMTNV